MSIFIYVYKLLTIAHLSSLDIFVSGSLVRENARGLREKLKHKIHAHSGASAIFGHFIAICHCAELFHQSTAVYPIFGASQAKNNNTQWFV